MILFWLHNSYLSRIYLHWIKEIDIYHVFEHINYYFNNSWFDVGDLVLLLNVLIQIYVYLCWILSSLLFWWKSRSQGKFADTSWIILISTSFFSILGGGWKLWKRLSLFVAFPAVALCMLNTYLEHQKMTVHRPEFVKYEYLRIRNKRFPWGDGNKSLFHVSWQ